VIIIFIKRKEAKEFTPYDSELDIEGKYPTAHVEKRKVTLTKTFNLPESRFNLNGGLKVKHNDRRV
jgi:hypothetical protein